MSTNMSSTGANGTTQSDIGGLWKTAVNEFERTTNTKFNELSPASNVEEILGMVQSQENRFNTFRHDRSRVDRFRSLVTRSLYPIEQMSKIISPAISSVSHPAPLLQTISANCVRIIVFCSRVSDIRSYRLSCAGNMLQWHPSLRLLYS